MKPAYNAIQEALCKRTEQHDWDEWINSKNQELMNYEVRICRYCNATQYRHTGTSELIGTFPGIFTTHIRNILNEEILKKQNKLK
jgi:hypothetical protein